MNKVIYTILLAGFSINSYAGSNDQNTLYSKQLSALKNLAYKHGRPSNDRWRRLQKDSLVVVKKYGVRLVDSLMILSESWNGQESEKWTPNLRQ